MSKFTKGPWEIKKWNKPYSANAYLLIGNTEGKDYDGNNCPIGELDLRGVYRHARIFDENGNMIENVSH